MDDYAEIVRQILSARLEDIKNGNSFFGKIPNNIGEIEYCDTTASEFGPYTSQEKVKRTLLGILIPVGIAALSYLLSIGFGIFVSIVALIIIIVVLKNTYIFKGDDMFVGTEGYAVYSFKKDRNNIVEEKVHRFEDLSDLVAEGTEVRNGAIGLLGLVTIYKGMYMNTQYSYSFFKKDGGKLKLVDGVQGTYDKEKVKDKAEIMDVDYRFWTCVEVMWSRYKYDEYKKQVQSGDDFISFALVQKETFIPDYIRLGVSRIIIGDTEYNSETLKNIGFGQGTLIVEHANHTTKLFGLIQKGNKEVIPLNMISNRMVFLELLGEIITIE